MKPGRGLSSAFSSPNSGNSGWRGSTSGRDRRRLSRALERRLARPCATSCSISEPLTLGTDEQAIGAFQIFDADAERLL
jgi:hypothetical protein